jgi:hypothetical protein
VSKNTLTENVFEDTVSPKHRNIVGFEIPAKESSLSNDLSSLNQSIEHDQAVTKEALVNLESDVKKSDITIGRETFTIEEAEKIPDLEMNMKIWEEIYNENFDNIRQLTYFPDGVAKFLIPYEPKGGYLLNLPNVSSISDKAAEYISQYDNSIQLNGLTSLSDTAAEFLAKSEKNLSLELKGLKTLSDNAAEFLGKFHTGKFSSGNDRDASLDLGCESLTDKALESLSHHAGYLRLNSLKALSDKGAEYLSKHAHGLQLNGLTHISDETAKYLSQHRCGVSLSGLTSISDKTAEYLSQSVRTEDREGNNSLSLVGLKDLSAQAAEYLGHYRGFSLALTGLTAISDEVAMRLSHYEGWLYLNGLTEISDKAAEYLSKLKGRKDSRTEHSLSLARVEHISDKALSFLKHYSGKLFLSDEIKDRMNNLK